jgi:cytochrome c-type biogenesis protein CcmF
MVLQRRGKMRDWTLVLGMSTFLLTLVGTFMTRSGVFNSVHSFTQSEIGPTILAFLGVSIVFSILLLAFRIDKLEAEGSIEGAASREAMFLVNNLIFVLLTFTVLIGTVFPLIVEAFNGKQMSVGRPFFDSMVVPLGAVLLFVLGIGPALPWGRATPEQLRKALLPPLFSAALFAIIGYVIGARAPWTLLTIAFGGYAAHVTLGQMFLPMLQRMKNGESLGTAFAEAQLRRGRRRFGSYIVHAAMVIVIIAIAISSSMRQTYELHFAKGQVQKVAGYDVKFLGVEQRSEPHRLSTVGTFDIARDGKPVARLAPRMNQYQSMREPIGTPDVHTTLLGDFYVSLSNIDAGSESASVNIYIAPFVIWIWISVIAMALGALFSLIPARRIVVTTSAKDPLPEGATETA